MFYLKKNIYNIAIEMVRPYPLGRYRSALPQAPAIIRGRRGLGLWREGKWKLGKGWKDGNGE